MTPETRIDITRAQWGDAAAEFVAQVSRGVPVAGAGPYPYQGANSFRDAGRIIRPDYESEDGWDHEWRVVAWDGRLWSAVTIPADLVGKLELR